VRITGELTMTWRIYRRLVLSQFGKRLWVHRIVGILLVICVGLLEAIRFEPRGAALILVLVVLAVFPYESVAALGWWQMRRVPGHHYSYTLTDDTIGIHTQVSDVSIRWDAVIRIRTRAQGWQIRTRVGGVMIPRAAFTDADQAEIDRFIGAGSFPRPTGVASS
jgi:hypothetical protein